MEQDLIKTKKKDDPSGTRTLLRLHRALEYIIAFLHKYGLALQARASSILQFFSHFIDVTQWSIA